jgi:tripartite-type tricarboxylate transporter receptor subunit TctC
MRAAPDGYTLLLGTAGALAISPVLSKNAPFDPVKDFTPVTAAVELQICLVVHKDVPVSTIAEFIAYAKANPGKLTFGSSGPNTTHHLAGEYLKSAAGIDMIHVPYRGGGPAMNDLIAGQIPALFATLSTTIAYMESGKLKVLGMVEAKRSAAYPDIPTIGETVPGYAVRRVSSLLGAARPSRTADPADQRRTRPGDRQSRGTQGADGERFRSRHQHASRVRGDPRPASNVTERSRPTPHRSPTGQNRLCRTTA